MVIDDAEHFALRSIVGGDIDGLIVSPAQQGNCYKNIEADSELFHGNCLTSPVYDGRAPAAGDVAAKKKSLSLRTSEHPKGEGTSQNEGTAGQSTFHCYHELKHFRFTRSCLALRGEPENENAVAGRQYAR